MKKLLYSIAGLVLLTAFGLFAFHAGQVTGAKSAMVNFGRESQALLALNSLAAYESYAEISEAVALGNLDSISCKADVAASAHVSQVRACLAQKECRDSILPEVKTTAPEILDAGKLRVPYYGNLELCFHSKPKRKR